MREKLVNESEVLAQAQAEADNLIRGTREYCDQLKYSVNQNLDTYLYQSAVQLNEAMVLIEGVRSEMRKRSNKDER